MCEFPVSPVIMQKLIVRSVLFISLSIGCTEKPPAVEQPSENQLAEVKPLPFMDQLFLFQESTDPVGCGTEGAITIEPVRTGVLRITRNGHVIRAMIDQQGDTMRYRWGTYKITDKAISYQLTDEYFYPGHWDDPWDVPDPAYAKGAVRKIAEQEVTITRTECNPTFYYIRYTERERKLAAEHYANASPAGLSYRPYRETKDMKFYSWLFEQIPVLADL